MSDFKPEDAVQLIRTMTQHASYVQEGLKAAAQHHEVERWAQDQGFFRAEMMGWLDLIEMVFDWRSAYLAYGSQGTWEDNMERQHDHYKDWFSPGQWWLIDQVAAFAGSEVK